ncbi:MAG: 4Fe-4S binding protein [Candidatus Marinimicrobia bacterium]|nr:4Fe-4S binding protein [Candidatus Neomarinimicrobiota bacterium]
MIEDARRNWAKLVFLIVSLVIFTATLMAEEAGAKASFGFWDVMLMSKVWIGFIFILIGLFLLNRKLVSQKLRLISLIIIFLTFSVFWLLPLGEFARGMGMHPSPVCAVTKPALFIKAGRGFPVVFAAVLVSMAVMSLIGKKLFCGWICPVGAAQELVYRISFGKKRDKKLKIKLPFKISNTVRSALFLLYLIIVATAGLSIYEYFNPFEFLHWGFELLGILVMLVTLISGLFIFRPFCYLVCPIGLFSWLLEHFALTRIKLDRAKCTDCDICLRKSPCPSIPAILAEKWSQPDCHACGRCIEVCPEDALHFKRSFR